MQVVKAREDCPALYRHRSGGQLRLWTYLHDRTGGSICALSDLIRESAIEAIISDEGAIIRKLMDNIETSDLAERHHATSKPKGIKATLISSFVTASRPCRLLRQAPLNTANEQTEQRTNHRREH